MRFDSIRFILPVSVCVSDCLTVGRQPFPFSLSVCSKSASFQSVQWQFKIANHSNYPLVGKSENSGGLIAVCNLVFCIIHSWRWIFSFVIEWGGLHYEIIVFSLDSLFNIIHNLWTNDFILKFAICSIPTRWNYSHHLRFADEMFAIWKCVNFGLI